MAYTLTHNIRIGDYAFSHVHSMEIKSSRNTLGETAVIKLPRRYKLHNLNETLKAGMPVYMEAGYNSQVYDKWSGYVSYVRPTIPVQIECEDEIYHLKRKAIAPKSWESTTLKDVLSFIVPDIQADVPDIKLAPFYITGNNLNAAICMEKIRSAYPFDIYFRHGKLFAGFPYTDKEAANHTPVKYDIRKNVIANNLTYRRAEDVRIKLKAVSFMPNNELIEVEWGEDGGELRTWHEYNKTRDELMVIVKEKLKTYKSDGYSGYLTAFGLPAPIHGQIAEISDSEFPDHYGRYFIDTVNTSIGITGYRRTVYIGRKAG